MATRSFKTAAGLLAAGALLTACGEQKVSLDAADSAKDSRINQGAEIFADKCSGCHTMESAGAQGSAVDIRDRERTDGPNFNTRREDVDSILYAIRNGGFSGAIMPENIVVGDDAMKVAEYLAKYAGRDIERSGTPDGNAPEQTAQPDDDGPDDTSGGSGGGTTTDSGQGTGSADEQSGSG